MPTAHLIHGFLGAGKTTFARGLEESLPAIRFTHDEWMSTLYGNDPPLALFPTYFRRVSDLLETVWPRCLSLGMDVVLDLNFWSRIHRDRVRSLVAASGGEYVLYRLEIPEEEAWRRVEARNRTLAGSLHITSDTFGLLKARFEPLDEDEPGISIE